MLNKNIYNVTFNVNLPWTLGSRAIVLRRPIHQILQKEAVHLSWHTHSIC